MDSVDLSSFTQEFANEIGLDLSTLSSPSMFTPFQEPNSSNCAGIENDGRQPISETTMQREVKKNNEKPKNKKMKHREIEKKRRQETTSLLRNLRDLLPSQYLSGTRSSSDHVRQAVKYIKDLQKRVREASEKKDRIKRSISHPSSIGECSIRSLASSSRPLTCSCVGDTHITVVVRSCLNGLEIVVSCCVRHISCLSSVLQLLAQEQCLDVVEEGIKISISELQEKIIKMVN